MSLEDLGRAVLQQQQCVERITLVAHLHSRRAKRHAGNRQAERAGPLGQQSLDIAGGALPATGAGRGLSDTPAGSGIAGRGAGGEGAEGEGAVRRGPGAGGLAGLARSEAPANAYITRDGLDWAWAAPVPAALADLVATESGAFGCPPAELVELPFRNPYSEPHAFTIEWDDAGNPSLAAAREARNGNLSRLRLPGRPSYGR